MKMSELSRAFAPPFEEDYLGDTNPHYFTVDVDENGKLTFWQGNRTGIELPAEAIKALINGDDFYRNTSVLLKIANDPKGFADELVKLLADSGRFARVEEVIFSNGVFEGHFSLDLGKLDIAVAPSSKRSHIYGDHDFIATASPYNLNFQDIYDAAASNYDRAYTNAHFTPKLDD
jgi:hypothetical protein